MKKCAVLVACFNDSHPNTLAQCTRCDPTIGSRLPYPCPLWPIRQTLGTRVSRAE